jgi:hypothetical protein
MDVGATAKSHAHLQAGHISNLHLPGELELMESEHPGDKIKIKSEDGVDAFIPTTLDRPLFVSRGTEAKAVWETAARSMEKLNHPWGMVNLIWTYEGGQWTNFVFPRIGFRPEFFHREANGLQQVSISPAALEMDGTEVTSTKENFDRLSRRHVDAMFTQVCRPIGELAVIAA